jgi:hypothetical protein
MSTTFMNLTLPTVSVTIGPAWATQLNAALTIIDSHNHSVGQGSQIGPSGINMDANLPFANFSATGVKTIQFNDQVATLSSATTAAIYSVGGDLYWNTGTGTSFQLTSGASLNAAGLGGIGGDYGTSTASAIYTTASKVFKFTQSTDVAALFDTGPHLIRSVASWIPPPQSTGLAGVTLAVDAAITTPWTLTLPASAPAATKFLRITSAGVVDDSVEVDGSTLEVASTSLQIKNGGVTYAKLASAAASGSSISAGGLNNTHLTPAMVSGSNIAATTVATTNMAALTVPDGGSIGAGTSVTSVRTTFTTLLTANQSITQVGNRMLVFSFPPYSAGITTCNISRAGAIGTVYYRMQRATNAGFSTGLTTIWERQISMCTAGATFDFVVPPEIDKSTAGTYWYRWQAAVDNASTTAFFSYVGFKVFEV